MPKYIDPEPLFKALETGSAKTVKKVIEKSGYNLNTVVKDGYTPLTFAISNTNSLELVEMLIDAGADLNMKDGTGNTPLTIAIYSNSDKYIDLLLSRGANINEPNSKGASPLIAAVHAKSPETVVKLLNHGADINSIDINGDTALMIALSSNPDLAMYLVKQGANVNVENYDNEKALDIALREDLAEDLIEEIKRRSVIDDKKLYKELKRFTLAEMTDYLTPKNLDNIISGYVRNPSMIHRHSHSNKIARENEENLKKYVDTSCYNLTKLGENVVVYIDSNQKRWCFTETQMKDICRSHINPYNNYLVNTDWAHENCDEEKCVNVSRSICFRGDPDAKLPISNETRRLIHMWTTEIYTFNQVFFYVNCDIRQELAPSRPCREIILYRGLSFQSEEAMNKFLLDSSHRNDRVTLDMQTFSSWTYEYSTADFFSRRYDYGLILECKFRTEDVLVDVTKIDYEQEYDEQEVIVGPGIYNATLSVLYSQ
jgi:hypothetical protein